MRNTDVRLAVAGTRKQSTGREESDGAVVFWSLSLFGLNVTGQVKGHVFFFYRCLHQAK